MKHSRLIAALVAGLSLPALAACTDNSSSADKGDGRTISVTSSDDACELSADKAPSGNLVYKVKNTLTLNERARGMFGRAGMAWEYALYRRGPMTAAPSQLGCFTRSDPSYDTPNLEYHVQPLSLDKFGEALHPLVRAAAPAG